MSRTAEAALEKIGRKSTTLTTLAGQAKTHLLGDSFYSQASILNGDYFCKVAISPVSPELVSLSERALETWPDSFGEFVEDHLGFDPWIGLAAHRPLGSVMRARRPAYAAARAYHAKGNEVVITEPADLPAG